MLNPLLGQPISFLHKLLLPALASLLLLCACKLNPNVKTEETITFSSLYDQLQGYETVKISLKDAAGNTIDVVFEGKVKKPGDLEKLPAPHWDGRTILVSIQAYDAAGNLTYKTETQFDGATNTKKENQVYLIPGLALSVPQTELLMRVGDTLVLPSITISPATITVRDVNWLSSAPEVVVLLPTGMHALKVGVSQITASLVADPSKKVILKVTVLEPAQLPDEVILAPDTLALNVGGPAGQLLATVTPSNAAKELKWTLEDTTIATVDANGLVKGLKVGKTLVHIYSALKPSSTDSAVVIVSEAVQPNKVSFSKEFIELFMGGGTDSLIVTVDPIQASQEIELIVSDSKIVSLDNGKLRGIAEGEATVIARSTILGNLKDTLKVKVSIKQVIKSVTLSEKSFTLYTGGPDKLLNATIAPSEMVQTVQWNSKDPKIGSVIAGKVTGLIPGTTFIYATSLADSTKKDSTEVTVKTDAPVLNVGRADTTVSLGATVSIVPFVKKQEFGNITQFKWDIDGLAGWEGTASDVQTIALKCDKEKEYLLRFYV